MARQKRVCQFCFATLQGRRDAKTCSERCRKTLQGASKKLSAETEKVAVRVERAVEEAESLVKPQAATEEGFIAATTPLLSNYATTNASADINKDGKVDLFDLSILLSHYGV